MFCEKSNSFVGERQFSFERLMKISDCFKVDIKEFYLPHFSTQYVLKTNIPDIALPKEQIQDLLKVLQSML